ncbi:MAG: succinyldiaminopimelate transaminase [Magnetococcales bacterium]|nr:succinyldiaminopimelate transaminase [Magnetococcales bacterium]
MNPLLCRLQPYPFEKLSLLLCSVTPPVDQVAIDLSIGEPRHPVAPFIRQAMAEALDGISRYPTTRGELPLRQAMASWLMQRFQLGSVDPDRQILPVNGTREALFSIAQAVAGAHVVAGNDPVAVLMPNPFYQIYEGATLLAGAEPVYVTANEADGFIPDYAALPPSVLQRTRLLYLCTPSNPTGSVLSLPQLISLIELADQHDFVIASDECYSEIWYDAPPVGLLQAAWQMGRYDFRRCLVFHSLSKRSNMPGARSGFVAGDAALLEGYFKLRTYTGCATPPFIQQAATVAWQDEQHVVANRVLYQQKLTEAIEILTPVCDLKPPDAGFYLWLRVPGGGEAFARQLFARWHVTVLPGAYLGRPDADGHNPGSDFVRVAMVAAPEQNREGILRIRECIQTMQQPL